MSPTWISEGLFDKKIRSPLWKAGAIDSEMTHITGEGDAVMMDRAFQVINGKVRVSRIGRATLKRACNRKAIFDEDNSWFFILATQEAVAD